MNRLLASASIVALLALGACGEEKKEEAAANNEAATTATTEAAPAASSNATTTEAAAPAAAPADTGPKQGGSMIVTFKDDLPTLDPAIGYDWKNWSVIKSVFDGLLDYKPGTTEIVPDLAESFEPSDAAKKWAFKLRKGATFHNGKEVTAADVVASYQHHMGKDSKSAAKSILDSVEEIKADGDNIVFTLKGGNADFPFYVSDYHLKIMPAKADGKAC